MRRASTSSSQNHSRHSNEAPRWVPMLSTLGGIIGGLTSSVMGVWAVSAIVTQAGPGASDLRSPINAFAFFGAMVGAVLGAIVGMLLQVSEAASTTEQRANPRRHAAALPRPRRRRRLRP